jgi:hypothetical protein
LTAADRGTAFSRGPSTPKIFTASLSHAVSHYRGRGGRIDNLYTDAPQFFGEGTYPTDGMRRLLREALLRLSGDNAAPAIFRLETAFGGGKTLALIADASRLSRKRTMQASSLS